MKKIQVVCLFYTREKWHSCDFVLRATLQFYFRPYWFNPDNVTEAYIPAMCVHSAKHIAKEFRGLFCFALATNDRSHGGIKVLNNENSKDIRSLKYPILWTLFEALKNLFFLISFEDNTAIKIDLQKGRNLKWKNIGDLWKNIGD